MHILLAALNEGQRSQQAFADLQTAGEAHQGLLLLLLVLLLAVHAEQPLTLGSCCSLQGLTLQLRLQLLDLAGRLRRSLRASQLSVDALINQSVPCLGLGGRIRLLQATPGCSSSC